MMSYFLPLPLRLLLLFRLRFLVPPENIPVNLDVNLSKMPGSFVAPDAGLLEEKKLKNLAVNPGAAGAAAAAAAGAAAAAAAGAAAAIGAPDTPGLGTTGVD
jgi:hypothetical protein